MTAAVKPKPGDLLGAGYFRFVGGQEYCGHGLMAQNWVGGSILGSTLIAQRLCTGFPRVETMQHAIC